MKRVVNRLNWYKLNFVEYASGIEVFQASLYFRNDKSLQKRILDHALDEYRHSKYFYELALKDGDVARISTPHGLINAGGLDKSPFLKNRNINALCTYLYLGEIRAIRFGELVLKNNDNQKIKDIFKIIDLDEHNHARGLKSYLNKRNKYKIIYYFLFYKLRFLLSDRREVKLYSKLRGKIENYIVKKIFNIFPESIFELADNGKDFHSSYKNRKRIS